MMNEKNSLGSSARLIFATLLIFGFLLYLLISDGNICSHDFIVFRAPLTRICPEDDFGFSEYYMRRVR